MKWNHDGKCRAKLSNVSINGTITLIRTTFAFICLACHLSDWFCIDYLFIYYNSQRAGSSDFSRAGMPLTVPTGDEFRSRYVCNCKDSSIKKGQATDWSRDITHATVKCWEGTQFAYPYLWKDNASASKYKGSWSDPRTQKSPSQKQDQQHPMLKGRVNHNPQIEHLRMINLINYI